MAEKKKKKTSATSSSTPTPESTPEPLATEEKPVAAPTPKVVTATPPVKKKAGKMWIVWVVVGVIVLAGAGAVGWVMYGTPKTTNTHPTTNTVANENVPVLVERPLDGTMVAEAQAKPNITAVMIENSTDSRPPSGLDKAPVVYEALAEGGITRFMALFPVGLQIPEIGPVRSARPYYISWAQAYYPMYVHAGGSPQALGLLGAKSTTVADFNQFTHGASFWRDTKRVAPHNLYTSSEKLQSALTQKFSKLQTSVQPWTFKDDAGLDTLPEITKDIVIKYSSLNYQVTYKYDRGLNQYNRYLGTKAHVTKDGTQITAKNVVVMFMPTGLIPGDTKRLQMTTVGSGKALVFRDGVAMVGTWKKTSAQSREQFYDANGQVIALNRGVTWVSAVPTNLSVTY